MEGIKELAIKSVRTLKEEGIAGFERKAKNFIHVTKVAGKDAKYKVYKDVLFINGCGETVPHPPRYRITHQREQLEANNISTNEVFYTNLQLDQVRFYRCFIFFRCPYTDMVGEFIRLAKSLNKRVLFDIDDLVVDTKYTDTIEYVQTLQGAERELYDDGVRRMGKTLSLCDAAITTTERLAEELGHYVPEVFINRNTASEIMCKLSEEVLSRKKEEEGKIKIGYFSGSMTHNADFKMILPALKRVMQARKEVYLHVVGELTVPDELKDVQERIVAHPFVDWKKLPELIAEVDINLAPIEESIFNEAKSENKWVEAALVKVPTVASNVGAFARMIEDGKTGLLCADVDEWERALLKLVDDRKERKRIANHAYDYCTKHCVTLHTGGALCEFLREKMTTNIAFVLPSLQISGGIMVALKHASMLQDAGYDVTLLNVDYKTEWYEYDNHRFPVIGQNLKMIEGRFDKAVATMWTTVKFLEEYPNINQRYYLVQNYETGFYESGNVLRLRANQSYCPVVPVNFITISKWCQDWLKEEYHQQSVYAPNGIAKAQFEHRRRKFDGKIRILIEGDCSAKHKNVDESFAIVDKLDLDKFEIWYMSYNAEPKENYHVDRFFHQVPYNQVASIYGECDILIKSSILESFSYPPLEMMATGGYVVVAPNGGNREYLTDGENCLMYPLGDTDKAVEAIARICSDEKLRESLYQGGIKTAQSRDWSEIKDEILHLYIG